MEGTCVRSKYTVTEGVRERKGEMKEREREGSGYRAGLKERMK